MPDDSKQQALALYQHISTRLDLYSSAERDLVAQDRLSFLREYDYPVQILERILFAKFSDAANSKFRIDLISKILAHNPHISIDDTLYLNFFSTSLMMFTAHGGSAINVCLLTSPLYPNPFIKDNKGKTFLHLIVDKGHKRNDDKYFDFEDQSPLFEATLDHIDVAEHINDQDIYGQTALHFAAAT